MPEKKAKAVTCITCRHVMVPDGEIEKGYAHEYRCSCPSSTGACPVLGVPTYKRCLTVIGRHSGETSLGSLAAPNPCPHWEEREK